MFKEQIPQINQDIKRTRRAIVALGCSFVQGHGAITDEIYSKYKWIPPKIGDPSIQWDLTPEEKIEIISTYPGVLTDEFSDQLNFSLHQYTNTFVDVLAKKYFNGDYAAINLGRSGCGNRAAIKELHYYPDINWSDVNEFIVIYCPSGMERFDLIDDTAHDPNNHSRWKCMWPNNLNERTSQSMLWKGYKTHLHSDKFEVLEQIAHMQELLLWCRYHNARLVIVPSFSRGYSESMFEQPLKKQITRTMAGDIKDVVVNNKVSDNSIQQLLKMWPWDNMFFPDNTQTFVDLVMKQEFPDTWEHKEFFYNYAGTGTPNMWITPCAHPSAKGHDVFAHYLYNELVTNPTKYRIK